jgi:hypothetical protein
MAAPGPLVVLWLAPDCSPRPAPFSPSCSKTCTKSVEGTYLKNGYITTTYIDRPPTFTTAFYDGKCCSSCRQNSQCRRYALTIGRSGAAECRLYTNKAKVTACGQSCTAAGSNDPAVSLNTNAPPVRPASRP